LTALSETGDEVKGIKEGGDDYIAKPYDSNVLLARINNLLRRRKKIADDITEYGSLVVNNITQRVFLDGSDINLTPKEFSVLAYFLKNPNKQLTAEEIYESVWGQNALNSAGTVRVRINKLREKLKTQNETPVQIKTVERKYYVCRVTIRTANT
jgi:DNA-binding response OmpR family regulator